MNAIKTRLLWFQVNTAFAGRLLRIPSLCILAVFTAGTANLFSAIHYVTPGGSVAPVGDQAVRPWQLVEAAARALPDEGGTVSISPGIYRETFVLASPLVLTAPEGGVTIGDLETGVLAMTSFRVFTWNTHLFGDIITFPLRWQDYERAEEMGAYLARRFLELDLVSLSEVWDEDLFVGGDGAAGIRPLSGFPNFMIFPDIKMGTAPCVPGGVIPVPRALHSGLALMTKHPMSDLRRAHYEACEGNCPELSESPDCLASKGFMATTVVKDGFSIRIYNTHTQAGYGADYVEARRKNISQLAQEIGSFRSAHPEQPILVMGDLNVVGDTAPEYAHLSDQFGSRGGRDAARNAAIVSIYKNPSAGHTLTSFNELALKFDAPHDQRLDYVWYFSSADGKTLLQPTYVERLLLRGATRTEDDFTSDELSDHYPIEASFRVTRTP